MEEIGVTLIYQQFLDPDGRGAVIKYGFQVFSFPRASANLFSDRGLVYI